MTNVKKKNKQTEESRSDWAKTARVRVIAADWDGLRCLDTKLGTSGGGGLVRKVLRIPEQEFLAGADSSRRCALQI